MIDIHTAQD